MKKRTMLTVALGMCLTVVTLASLTTQVSAKATAAPFKKEVPAAVFTDRADANFFQVTVTPQTGTTLNQGSYVILPNYGQVPENAKKVGTDAVANAGYDNIPISNAIYTAAIVSRQNKGDGLTLKKAGYDPITASLCMNSNQQPAVPQSLNGTTQKDFPGGTQSKASILNTDAANKRAEVHYFS